MVPLKAKSKVMTSEGPRIFRGPLKSILENSHACKVTGRTYAQSPVDVEIGMCNGYPGDIWQIEDVRSVVLIRVPIRGMSESFLTDKTKALRPDSIGRNGGGIFEGEEMRSSGWLLRKISHLADGKRGIRRIILIIILGCEPVFGAEVVVDSSVDLVGAECRFRSDHQCVIPETLLTR